MGVCNPTRLGAASVGLVLAGGCGSDNPVIDSSNRGSNSHTKDTTVQNAYIVPRFQPGSGAIQVGDAAALAFTATNNRSTESERLLAIATDAAEAVHISPAAPLEIPLQSSIAAGQSIEQVGASGQPFAVSVDGLRESARPGTSVEVTLVFDRIRQLR